MSLITTMDLLCLQATNIQTQIDSQQDFNKSVSDSLTTIADKLQTLHSTVSDLAATIPSGLPAANQSSPPVVAGDIADTFAAADAAISHGIMEMENELGSSLDQNISARSPPTSPTTTNVPFGDVTDRWSNRERPHDLDAAYTASRSRAHASPSSTETLNMEYSTHAQTFLLASDQCHNDTSYSYGDILSP